MCKNCAKYLKNLSEINQLCWERLKETKLGKQKIFFNLKISFLKNF